MDVATLGKTPIQGGKSTGGDVRYAPEFEALQVEFGKLASPTASGQVDWEKIVTVATHILATLSKDLTVASYLAVGLLHTRKVDGLDMGLQVLRDLLETYWDDLYPPQKRMRGRAGAIAWWAEKTDAELQKIDIPALPAEQAERMQANLKHIDELLIQNMPDPPLLRSVQRRIEAIPVQKSAAALPTAPVDPSTPAAPTAQKQKATAPAAVQAPETIGNEQDAHRAVAAAFRTMRNASLFFLQYDLKHPLAYCYRRIASWSHVTALPSNTDGTTQIQSPPPQAIDALNALRDEDNWPAFIQNAEQKLSQFIFWLDLNRHVAKGLTTLGSDYQKALTAVCQETAYLLQRLPGLEALTFSDGMPFADTATRQWLQSIRFGSGPAEASAVTAMDSAQDNHLAASLQKAHALARKKQLIQAVNLLQQEMLQSVSRSQQMRWRLAIAQVLRTAKKPLLALPHLEKVLDDIDQFQIEIWDPPLALEGLLAAWKVFEVQTTGNYKTRAEALLHRIANIDPAEALRLNK